jgi:hypothetical protein
MYARLVTGSIAPDRLDEAIRLWQESVSPSRYNCPSGGTS